ncbi:MAG: TonB-dependent receptor family protein, partial [Longimicrobiales bacterium]
AYPVSVVGQQELRQGKTGMFLEESLQALPGVQIQNRYNYAVGERVLVRGFGSRTQFGVRGLHVVVDGIPATLPDGQSTIDHLDLGSLGRVEALRGPASALYGNSSGGVLRFESQAPPTVPVREDVTVMGGSDGMLRLQSLTSGTAGETGYLLSVDRLSYDGFRETDDGDIYGAADRLHVNGRVERPLAGGDIGVTFNYVDLDAENAGSVDIDQLSDGRHEINDFVYIGNGTGKELQQGQLGLRWTGPLAGVSAETLVYGITRDFSNPIPFNVVDVERAAGGARLAVRSPDAPGSDGIRWQAGVDWDIQDDDRREFDNDNGNPTGSPNIDQAETVQSVGIFAQGMVPLTDRFNVVGGIRYDYFDFQVEDRIPLSQDPTDDSGSRTLDAVSPTVGVHLATADEVDVFANWSTFFETPTTVELANRPTQAGGFNPDLEPQDGWTVEVGTRGTLQERFSYELSVFTTQLTNELVQFEVAGQPGVNFYRNAGESTRIGVEALARARLHERVSGQISYAYTDAEFDEYVVDGSDFSGNQVPGLAPHNLQASLRYEANPGYLEVTADYRDEIPVNDANEAFTESYTLFDVRVGAERLQVGNVDFSPFAGIRNITDELYSASVAVNAVGDRFYEPGPGRTFYVGLSTGIASR